VAIVSWSHRYLFLQAPRTGCTAVARGVLIPHLGGERLPADHIVDAAGRRVVHAKHAYLPTLLAHGVITEEQLASLFTFSTVRNPFDREVSLYTKMRSAPYDEKVGSPQYHRNQPADAQDAHWARSMSFSDWVVRRWCRRTPFGLRVDTSRHPWLAAGGHARDAQFVMRFEHLQADFDEALDRIGVTQHYDIPIVNVTQGRQHDYRTYYTPKARRVIETVFATDLQQHGYEF
jgi:hypothetical protein